MTTTTEYIIDTNGRRGIVTRSDHHTGGIFARPAEYAYLEGNCIMATWFADQGDGTFRGIWADSPFLAPSVIATLVAA